MFKPVNIQYKSTIIHYNFLHKLVDERTVKRFYLLVPLSNQQQSNKRAITREIMK